MASKYLKNCLNCSTHWWSIGIRLKWVSLFRLFGVVLEALVICFLNLNIRKSFEVLFRIGFRLGIGQNRFPLHFRMSMFTITIHLFDMWFQMLPRLCEGLLIMVMTMRTFAVALFGYFRIAFAVMYMTSKANTRRRPHYWSFNNNNNNTIDQQFINLIFY